MTRPLPGIHFQAEPPALADKLPRMDVAAFVGFASSGPLHVPVAVEDEVHFRRIFGADPPLAWDEARGDYHRGYLGAAVGAFFRNGGRRCWVVRVAGEGAVANRYLLPGLMRAGDTEWYRAAQVGARSEGAWSDGLLAGAALTPERVKLVGWQADGAGMRLALSRHSAAAAVREGDLIRVTFPATVLYLAVQTVQTAGDLWQVRGREFWFRRELPVTDSETGLYAWLRPPEGNRSQLTLERWVPPAEAGGEHRLYLIPHMAPPLGSLLELQSLNNPTMLLSVTGLRPAGDDELKAVGLKKGPFTVLSGRDPLIPMLGAAGRASVAAVNTQAAVAERLTLELLAEEGGGRPLRLTGVGLAPGHPRYLTGLPTDSQLFGGRDPALEAQADAPVVERSPWADAVEPRFPLAGWAGAAGDIFLPLGMPLLPTAEQMAGPVPSPLSAAVRSGLAAFDPLVFLDGDLTGLTADGLRSALVHKRYVMGQRLKGLHALWPLDEVTLLAVPDAIHPPWVGAAAAIIYPLDAPDLALTSTGLGWKSQAGATGYQVQFAAEPSFAGPIQTVEAGGKAKGIALPDEAPGCHGVAYCRVRALRDGERGPWSVTLAVDLTQSGFAPCSPPYPPAPTLVEPFPEGANRYTIHWTQVPGAESYLLEEAGDTDFYGARELYNDKGLEVTIVRTGDQPTYYRVRAMRQGTAGLWSATVWLQDAATRQSLAVKPDLLDTEKVRFLHDAVLRFCLARGDLLAVFSLPVTFREQETAGYVRSLTARQGAVEEKALTYGTLYHPWTWVQEEAGALRLIPPDGAMAGQMARVAWDRGAWIAPANRPLDGVVALAPPLGGLPDLPVNLLQREARGFLALQADTLSLEESLRPIGVRRLMMLLRRLALREGNALVFEPNDDAFARLVERRFERFLGDMFLRGAFAGATAREGFQVVTGLTVNTPQARENGQFVVELRVAPSRPLTFLTVRLIQSQGAAPTAREV